ncbi:MAG: GNAT family N-acetyltransferase [Chloroflexi bacterium RBG_16_48_8]|nr:MAG: GNAT family N-acetyltransferase [Chloroflexi bacterium RBG_16_48_8]
MSDFILRPIHDEDKEWIARLITDRWGSEIIVVHQTLYTPTDLPGIVAVRMDKRVGLITYHIRGHECEIVTLDSLSPSIGIGTSLIREVRKIARDAGCRRLWLITTNDNVQALRFYQKRGFVLVAIHRNAVEGARKIKPEIPMVNEEGIPIRDEIELEMILDALDEE